MTQTVNIDPDYSTTYSEGVLFERRYVREEVRNRFGDVSWANLYFEDTDSERFEKLKRLVVH